MCYGRIVSKHLNAIKVLLSTTANVHGMGLTQKRKWKLINFPGEFSRTLHNRVRTRDRDKKICEKHSIFHSTIVWSSMSFKHRHCSHTFFSIDFETLSHLTSSSSCPAKCPHCCPSIAMTFISLFWASETHSTIVRDYNPRTHRHEKLKNLILKIKFPFSMHRTCVDGENCFVHSSLFHCLTELFAQILIKLSGKWWKKICIISRQKRHKKWQQQGISWMRFASTSSRGLINCENFCDDELQKKEQKKGSYEDGMKCKILIIQHTHNTQQQHCGWLEWIWNLNFIFLSFSHSTLTIHCNKDVMVEILRLHFASLAELPAHRIPKPRILVFFASCCLLIMKILDISTTGIKK